MDFGLRAHTRDYRIYFGKELSNSRIVGSPTCMLFGELVGRSQLGGLHQPVSGLCALLAQGLQTWSLQTAIDCPADSWTWTNCGKLKERRSKFEERFNEDYHDLFCLWQRRMPAQQAQLLGQCLDAKSMYQVN